MEWAQDATLLATTYSHQQNIDGSSAAFIQSDFSFRGPNDRSFSPSNTLNLVDIEIVRLKWRFQKHLEIGQEIHFAKDTYPVSLRELFFISDSGRSASGGILQEGYNDGWTQQS